MGMSGGGGRWGAQAWPRLRPASDAKPCTPRPPAPRRYRRNWLKVRALGLVQYDAVLLVDADVAVTGALHPLFSMPVEFAAAWDQSKWLNRCAGKGARRSAVAAACRSCCRFGRAGSGCASTRAFASLPC